MSAVKANNGKAFEYACLNSLYKSLCQCQDVEIEQNAPLETANRYFENAKDELKLKLVSAADAAARVVIKLEPQLQYPAGNEPLILSIQSDTRGISGDVRDILCKRAQNSWEIGLSCKHNHHALKHSRLSSSIDFGALWLGIACTPKYFNAVTPLFDELRSIRDASGKTALWSDVTDKNKRFYIPLLQAFTDELKRLDKANPCVVPNRFIRYLIGKNDFYKIITDDARRTTRIDGINIQGSLNKPSNDKRSIARIPRLKLPLRFYDIHFKNNLTTTIEIVCDEGFTVSMRIHNASSRVEPSLKFDVTLISRPNTVYSQNEPW